MSCNIPIEQDSVLANCPNDAELIIFFNVVGQPTKTALRTWAQVKACLGISKPIAGAVGTAGLPAANSPTYTDTRLIGLGSTNNGNVQMFVAGIPTYNYGNNIYFELDNVNGIITLLDGSIFNAGDSINIDTNQ